jgi:predicted Rossmann-fold nucleotide-binding protein
METVWRGAKFAGAKTDDVTAEFFVGKANAWIDLEVRMKTWDERRFELPGLGEGFLVCQGGADTLAELAVLSERQNQAVIKRKPIVALGGFCTPILSRVREAEVAANKNAARAWPESFGPLIKIVGAAPAAAGHPGESLGKS